MVSRSRRRGWREPLYEGAGPEGSALPREMKRPHTLVIGGTRGIGRAVVRTLAAEAHVVSVIGRRKPAPKDVRLSRVTHWVVDLLDAKALDMALKNIVRKNGKLSHVVFCQRFRGTGDTWAGEVQTSLDATKDLIERLTSQFAGKGEKAIVIVASIA